MPSLKKLVSQTAIYGVSSIIGRFLNYLLVPLYTYKISMEAGGPGAYGMVTNVYAYTALLMVLLTFGMESTFFYFANRDDVDAKKAFSTAANSVGLVALLFWIACMVFGNSIAVSLGYAEHPEYIRMMTSVVALDAFQAILFSQLRYQNRPMKFAFLKVLFIVLNIAMNLFVFLVAPSLKETAPALMSWYHPADQVRYIFAVNLLCTSLITFGFIPEMRNLRFGIDWGLLKKMLKYTWPLLLLGLAGILNQVADKICYRFIIPGAEGDAQLGIYGACVKIAMIIALFTQAFRYAYEPLVFGSQKDKNSKESQAVVMKYFVMFTLLAFLIVVCYMDILKYFIQRNYWSGLRAVPIVMMAEIFMGIYFNLSFWYKLNGQTWWGSIFSGIGCVVLLAINFIFVPHFGYMACAWGGFAGYGICMVLSYLVGQKKNPIPYNVKAIFGYFALAVGLYCICDVINTGNTWVNLVLKTLLLLVYLGVMIYFERAMVNRVMNMVTSRFKKNKTDH
ncbi:MAG: lipopolysaccharide biosynthesis protein [Bacteroidales bacterium]|nr:lipopolysaccharide biosynthesis protein [Bacteroidales bacterium]